MVDFDKSDKIRKIRGKVDKPDPDNEFSNDVLFLFKKRDFFILRKSFLNKDEISLNPLSVSGLSIFQTILLIYCYGTYLMDYDELILLL